MLGLFRRRTVAALAYAATDRDCGTALVKIPGALGPCTLAEITADKRPPNTPSCNGVMPPVRALAAGAYPLAKPHYLVGSDKRSQTAQPFVRFVESSSGRGVPERVGYLVATAGKGR
jgi:phosphate transport system substrate-binding protein